MVASLRTSGSEEEEEEETSPWVLTLCPRPQRPAFFSSSAEGSGCAVTSRPLLPFPLPFRSVDGEAVRLVLDDSQPGLDPNNNMESMRTRAP